MYLSLAFIVLSLKTRTPPPLTTTAFLSEEHNNAMPEGKMAEVGRADLVFRFGPDIQREAQVEFAGGGQYIQ